MKTTGNKSLLDTNIVIEIFNGNAKNADKVNSLSAFSISAVVLGELYIGINNVANKSKHLKMLENFLQLCTIFDIDAETAKHYGVITSELHKKGKPIPTNDIWIAASAKQHGFTVITRDKHFNEIRDVHVTQW